MIVPAPFEPFDAVVPDHFRAVRSAGDASETELTRAGFAAAAAEIRAWDGYAPTQLQSLDALAGALGLGGILYKDEGARFGLGSFKALGGAYAAGRVLVREINRQRGTAVTLEDIRAGRQVAAAAAITLTSATDGNHGRSLAWGASRLGARCVIYIHAEVSEGRAQAIRDLGAEVVRIEGDYDDSVRMARQNADANGWFVVSDTSWEGYVDPPRDVMAGYGVMVDEAVVQCTDPPTHVVVQGGVGGLAAAVFARLRQTWGVRAPRMIVVEPDLAACLIASARAGTATSVAIDAETVMAGLSCGEPSEIAWRIISQECTDFLTIPDALVAPTMRLLAHPIGDDPVVAAGESAVAGLAVTIAAARHRALAGELGLDADSRVLVFGTEGVTDADIYAQMIAA